MAERDAMARVPVCGHRLRKVFSARIAVPASSDSRLEETLQDPAQMGPEGMLHGWTSGRAAG